MNIYQQFQDAYKRTNDARATYESAEHLHYYALKHLRDCMKTDNRYGIENAIDQADRLEKEVCAAEAQYCKAADSMALISEQMKEAA